MTAAFEYAKKRGFKGVTICEKPNVVRETSGMMEEVAKEVAKNYPGIALWSTNIDAQLMWLNKNPEEYNVIVSSNLFGDILSDAFAGLVGGLGFAASGNIGEDVAVFEPTHGSAPKYADLNPPIVNPIAMILSAAMMLDHVGEGEKANRIRTAIADVVREGKVRTYDMMRFTGGPKAISQGAASHGADDERNFGESAITTRGHKGSQGGVACGWSRGGSSGYAGIQAFLADAAGGEQFLTAGFEFPREGAEKFNCLIGEDGLAFRHGRSLDGDEASWAARPTV